MYQNKPVIGLMPLYDELRDSYWMLPGYMKALQEQGAIPLMLPLTEDPGQLDYFLDACDGFLLTGGQDVTPALYGAQADACCGVTCPERDGMDRYVLREAVERDKAVLGICRGHQLMNAAFGGTLYQDLPTQHPSAVNHRMDPPYDGCAHLVSLCPGTPLWELLGAEECPVNSCHHQGIRDLAPAFAAMAMAPDGLAEGIYMPEKRFVWGVQWHPEFAYRTSPENRKIIAAFLRAAAE